MVKTVLVWFGIDISYVVILIKTNNSNSVSYLYYSWYCFGILRLIELNLINVMYFTCSLNLITKTVGKNKILIQNLFCEFWY